ncbi:MAG: efflux RND transporter periplasmic adaptor subunit [Verrucomicrobia bacterium]|nr:efflux RND transporter periplasmic adaptor subunit [Verrucomicrobiota bacterium]
MNDNVLAAALAFAGFTASLAGAVSPEKAAATVILNETGVQNLKIQTVEAEETDFEQTVFALGRIQAIPERRAVVASRVPGRIMELRAVYGTMVEAGADVARLESRQPGNPPPSLWLKAPTSGLVTVSEARIGEPVDPDKTLLEITDLSEVFAIARIPEHMAGKIKMGAAAHIRVAALPGETFEGTLLRFGTAADRVSGTIDAVFALPNPSLLLRPDLRAEFSIVLSKRENVLSIPKMALQGDALDRFVYVKDYELPNAFVKSPVQIGASNDRFVEVLGGLIAGDEVVTTGAYSLAFAGKGSVSLKEALDAAHGHEHNEDGSEVTGAQKSAGVAGEGHTHSGASESISTLTLFSLASNVLLLLMLALRSKPPVSSGAGNF